MKKLPIFMLCIVFCVPSFAQNSGDQGSVPEIKELTDFHNLIFKIWHTAVPRKNINLLKSYEPLVEEGYTKIKRADLPAILKDEKTAWEAGLKKLGVCVDLYKVASQKRDSVALLNAAEKLHAQYEAIVRIINPSSKEAGAFHRELNMLYYNYLPDKTFDKFLNIAANLNALMDGIEKIKFSAKNRQNESVFINARNELARSVKKLDEDTKADSSRKTIEATVEEIHKRYLEFEKTLN